MQVSLEQAYAEACRVIGEQIVERRLLAQAQQEEEPSGNRPEVV